MPDPTAITLIPSSVVLKQGGAQVFVAVAAPPVAGAPAVANASSITWNLSPNIGTMGSDGKYQAPEEVSEDAAIKVTAIDSASGNHAEAAISLLSPDWRGPGAAWLGIYILLVFSTIFLLIQLWPLESLNPESAKTARLEAQNTFDQSLNALKAAAGADTFPPQQPNAPKPALSGSTPGPSRESSALVPATQTPSPSALSATPRSTSARSAPARPAAASAIPSTTVPAPSAQSIAKEELLKQLQTSVDHGRSNLTQKEGDENKANSATVLTRLSPTINRELDLLLIVVLAGMLGAFLHLAQSFSDFTGNRSLKSSWLWWYVMRPFIGGGLALVFYAALRGGLVSIVPASNTSTANLNTSGLIALSALVGLFSKAATSKLGEVFDTLFRTDAAGKTKDKVDNKTQPPPQGGPSAPVNLAPQPHV